MRVIGRRTEAWTDRHL